MTDLDVLWQPMRLGSLTVNNRIFLPAHELGLGAGGESHGNAGDRYVAYFAERARGGTGLLIAGGASVHPWGERFSHLPIWSKDVIAHYAKLADAVHEYDSKLFMQLYHCGVQDNGTEWLDTWHPVVGPSALPSPFYNRIAKAMDRQEIAETVMAFAQAAQNMAEAGFDGFELSAGHGYLLSEFLSPLYNRRSDEYGGSVENRCRIVLEVAEAVRDRCGEGTVVGIRLNYDEHLGTAGITPDQADEIIGILDRSKLFDFFHISAMTYNEFHRLVAPMTIGVDAPFAPYAARARGVVQEDVPVFVTGVIRDLERAAEIVTAGHADMIGMARAHLADPEIVRKARTGRVDEIRHCVGANQGCLRRNFNKRAATCTVNPAVGREAQWGTGTLRQATSPRRVVVVGGGPAGMQAAETAARRGHQVTLVERESELGGQLRFAGRLPFRDRWLVLIDDLKGMLTRAGVDVRLGVDVTLDWLREFAPDITVLATGSAFDTTGFSIRTPHRESIPGADSPHVIDPVEAITNLEACADSVVVVDDNGDHLPLGLAQLIAESGRKVEVVSTQPFAGNQLAVTNDLPYILPRVLDAGATVTAQLVVDRIDSDSVTVSSTWGGSQRKIAAGTVVLSMMRHSTDGLYDDLVAAGMRVERIGDCVAPREVDDAIYEAVRLARSL